MENNNSVCYVARIEELNPIDGADKIEQAIVKGWSCIVPKNTYHVGEKVVCIITDAVIPDELAEQLQVKTYLRKGNRVRTVKLKGVYSECLIISCEHLLNKVSYFAIGMDLMPYLNIVKYEPPIKDIIDNKGRKHRYQHNPNFHVYYKFPNIKNVTGLFVPDDHVIVTRKLHGTNARYGIVKKAKLSIIDRIKLLFGNKWAGYEFVYGSHNVEKGSDSQGFYSTDVWKEINNTYKIKEKLWKVVKELTPSYIGSGFVIYGEIYGPGIQGEAYSYGLKSKELALFDLTIDGEYADHIMFLDFAYALNLPIVPILYNGKFYYEGYILDRYVFDQFIYNTKVPHEGVVVKCITGARNKVAKFINPAYSIYSEKHNIPDSH